jgi:hypothetical protein
MKPRRNEEHEARQEDVKTAKTYFPLEFGTLFENRCCASSELQQSLRGFGGERGFSRLIQCLSRVHPWHPCHPRTDSASPLKSVQTSDFPHTSSFSFSFVLFVSSW